MQQRTKNSNFAQFDHEVVDHGIWAAMSGGACKVFGVLLRHANYGHRKCYPSRETIVRTAGVNKNKITDYLDELTALGLITIKHSGRNFGFRNIYTVTTHPPKPTFPMQISGKNTCPVNKDKRTGKFCKSNIKDTHTYPSPGETNTCPLATDKNENEIEKRDLASPQPSEIEALDNVSDPKLKEILLRLYGHLPVNQNGLSPGFPKRRVYGTR